MGINKVTNTDKSDISSTGNEQVSEDCNSRPLPPQHF